MKLNNKIKFFLLLIIIFLFFYMIFLVWPKILNILLFILKIILPFVISFSICYMLEPIVEFFKKYLKKRTYAVIITLILFILVLYFFFSITIPFLYDETKEFMNNYESIIDSLEIKVNEFSEKFDFLPINYQPTFDNIKEILNEYIEKIQLGPSKILNKIFSYISVIVVIPMTLFYFLIDYEKIICYFRNKLIENDKIHLKNYLGELNKSISKFVKTTFVIMLLVLGMSTIAFWIAGLEYPLFFGVIIAVTNIIPYIGPYLGGVFPVLFALIDSEVKALAILIIIIVIQIIESDIISPYLHGKNNDIHPLIVIFGLIIFGKLFGVVGMIISVPLLSMIKITLKYYPIKLFNKTDQNIT